MGVGKRGNGKKGNGIKGNGKKGKSFTLNMQSCQSCWQSSEQSNTEVLCSDDCQQRTILAVSNVVVFCT